MLYELGGAAIGMMCFSSGDFSVMGWMPGWGKGRMNFCCLFVCAVLCCALDMRRKFKKRKKRED